MWQKKSVDFVSRYFSQWISKTRAQDGVAAIEFAIIAPLFLMLLFGILQFGIYIYESSVLEGGLNTASREGKTGYCPSCTNYADSGAQGGTRWNYIAGGDGVNPGISSSSVLASQIGALLSPEKVTFTATAYPGFAYIGLPAGSGLGDSGQVDQSLGPANAVTVYTASYPAMLFPFMSVFLGTHPKITVYDIVQNEPFSNHTLFQPALSPARYKTTPPSSSSGSSGSGSSSGGHHGGSSSGSSSSSGGSTSGGSGSGGHGGSGSGSTSSSGGHSSGSGGTSSGGHSSSGSGSTSSSGGHSSSGGSSGGSSGAPTVPPCGAIC